MKFKSKNLLFLCLVMMNVSGCGNDNNSSDSLSNIESSESSQISDEDTSLLPTGGLITTEDSSDTSSNQQDSNISDSDSGQDIDEPVLLEIHSLEVKQRYGDATLIKYDDFEILVDGGERGDDPQVKKALETYVEDGYLDMLIVSHPHSDHVGGLINLSTFSSLDNIGMIIDTGYDYGVRKTFKTNVLDHFVSLGTDYYKIADVMKEDELKSISIDDNCTLNFLNTSFYEKYDTTSNLNNTSIAFYIQYNNTILFMGGDIESAAENSIMALNSKFTTDENQVIYKASHHGSKGSNTTNFLRYIQPDYCFASSALLPSSGMPNLNQHPYYEAILRMSVYTKSIYWNGINGNLNMYTDGNNPVLIEGEGRSVNYSYYDSLTSTSSIVSGEEEKNITYPNSKWYLTGMENSNWADIR